MLRSSKVIGCDSSATLSSLSQLHRWLINGEGDEVVAGFLEGVISLPDYVEWTEIDWFDRFDFNEAAGYYSIFTRCSYRYSSKVLVEVCCYSLILRADDD